MIGRIEDPGEQYATGAGNGGPDEGLRVDSDDELLVTLLRPAAGTLPVRPGSYERIRRGATRRRRLRAAVGGGVLAATVGLVALPVLLVGSPAARTAPVGPAGQVPTTGSTAPPSPGPSATRSPSVVPSVPSGPQASSSPSVAPTAVSPVGIPTSRPVGHSGPAVGASASASAGIGAGASGTTPTPSGGPSSTAHPVGSGRPGP